MKGTEWCLFDVDDTLISSNVYLSLYSPIVTGLVNRGIPFTKLNREIDRIKSISGGGRPDTYDLCEQFNALDLYYKELSKHVSAQPRRTEVKRLFDALREMGRKIGIVSNSHRRTVKMILEHHDVSDSIDFIFCCEDSDNKDTITFWNDLIRSRDIDPSTAIVIDNSKDSLDNASVAGFRTHLVDTLVDFNTLKFIV